ncbi:MAG: hypothetical protein KA764_11100 [Anaerolineales bacterium]|nr:hypothetical protein [Anaerolineales bacterium]
MRRRALGGLCLWLAGLAVFNAVGAWSAWETRPFLATLPLAVPPAYLIGRGAVWAAALAGAALAVWRRWPGARAGAGIVFGAYLACSWFERLVQAPASHVQTTLVWALAVDALSLAFVVYAVWPARPSLGKR